MKIQIIGLGIVGTAQAYLSQKMGHNIIGYDIKSDNYHYCDVSSSVVRDVDITFICTPESEVETVVDSLIKIDHTGIIVVRSTTPIGTIKYISEKFGIHIIHNPEFLREEYYLEDIMNPNVIVIGECCQEHGSLLESFYRPINKPIVRVDETTSELIKLTNNAYLSILITFWNEINDLSKKLNVNIQDVSDSISYDPRISTYGRDFFGVPYGGKCLPKDIKYLIDGFRFQGLNPKLFEACEYFNDRLIEKLKENKEKE